MKQTMRKQMIGLCGASMLLLSMQAIGAQTLEDVRAQSRDAIDRACAKHPGYDRIGYSVTHYAIAENYRTQGGTDLAREHYMEALTSANGAVQDLDDDNTKFPKTNTPTPRYACETSWPSVR